MLRSLRIVVVVLLGASSALGADPSLQPSSYAATTVTRRTLSICQLLATSERLIVGTVTSVGVAQQLTFEGFGKATYTPVRVEVTSVLKPDSAGGTPLDVWVLGYVSPGGVSSEGLLAVDMKVRSFLVEREGRLLVAAQGLFGFGGDGRLRNEFHYRKGIATAAWDAEVAKHAGRPLRQCPDDGQEMRP